ncbi:hypothetical protein GGS21DRAFT_423227 [Xylaria nigripes]|nr:hypothetical protein GGS21DRAFT_423227 [Xylaria nigripes]
MSSIPFQQGSLLADGAIDEYQSQTRLHALPSYDTAQDANTIPIYTRDHLQSLSEVVETRLSAIEETNSLFPPMIARVHRLHKWMLGLFMIFAAIWLGTSAIVIVAIYTGKSFWLRGG